MPKPSFRTVSRSVLADSGTRTLSPKEAAESLLTKYPGADIEDLRRVGMKYVAKVRIAEFPPKKDEDGGEDKPKEDKPKDDEPKDETDDEPADEGGDDDPLGDLLGGDDAPGDDGLDAELDKPKSKGDEILDLLHQVLDAVKGGGDLGLEPPHPHGGPDVPPAPDGPPAGAGGAGAPLPPPVEAPHKPKLPGAFAAALKGRRSFEATLDDATKFHSNSEILAEAAKTFPGHRVAQLNWIEGGTKVRLAMVRKAGTCVGCGTSCDDDHCADCKSDDKAE